jgi:hypothetical protein
MSWHILYMFAAYLSAAFCIYTAIRQGWPDALVEVLLFVLLVVGFWLLESWATHVNAFYVYSPLFPDRVPFFPFGSLSWVSTSGLFCPYFCPVPNPCPPLDTSAGISLSVVVMEASLTFGGMWTARLLAPNLMLLWPFLVGLMMLSFDIFLDPVVSLSAHCVTHAPIDPGLGFWEWYVHEDLWIQWFGIPLFNYAAWFFAPIAAVAGGLLLKWKLRVRWPRGRGPGGPGWFPIPLPVDLLLRALIFWAATLLFALAPFAPWAIRFKVYVMLTVILLTVSRVFAARSQYCHTNGLRWAIIIPQAAFHFFSLVALLLSGTHPLFPLLIFGLVCVVLGMWYCLAPYFAAARQVAASGPRNN